jgi:hypothetical protein
MLSFINTYKQEQSNLNSEGGNNGLLYNKHRVVLQHLIEYAVPTNACHTRVSYIYTWERESLRQSPSQICIWVERTDNYSTDSLVKQYMTSKDKQNLRIIV